MCQEEINKAILVPSISDKKKLISFFIFLKNKLYACFQMFKHIHLQVMVGHKLDGDGDS